MKYIGLKLSRIKLLLGFVPTFPIANFHTYQLSACTSNLPVFCILFNIKLYYTQLLVLKVCVNRCLYQNMFYSRILVLQVFFNCLINKNNNGLIINSVKPRKQDTHCETKKTGHTLWNQENRSHTVKPRKQVTHCETKKTGHTL